MNGSRPRAPGPLAISAVATLPFVAIALFLFLNDLWMPPGLRHEWWWGGLQMWSFPAVVRIAAALVAPAVLLMPEPWVACLAGLRLPPRWTQPLVAIPLVIVGLWAIRSTALVIGDATFYVTDLIPEQAFSERGLLINYDSIGASLLYSRGYHFAKLYFGLDVLTWYNVAGLVCFAAGLAWLWAQWRRGAELATPGMLLLLLAGNWSQSCLGAPEHYGQVLMFELAFAIVAVEALRGRAPLWQPCLAFGIGAFFHLMIGWLFPALLFVVASRWRTESRDDRHAAVAALLLPAFFTGLVCYSYGFEISFLAGGNAAEGKLIPFLDASDPYTGENYQYSTLDPRHLAHIAQELLLMGWPGILALVAGAPLLPWKRLVRDPAFRFAALFFAGGLMLNLLWNPDLEIWRDQDLFSMVGIGACVLGAVAISSADLPRATRRRLLLAAVLGGLAWRIPVILWHSVLSPQYYDPTIEWWRWPFR